MNFNKIKLWRDPYDWVMGTIKGIPKGEPEMSGFDSMFLCGILHKYRPRKVLEVGVAAGGTTAIILKALTLLGIERFDCYSIDIVERYYRDRSKKCGFLGEQAKVLLETDYSFNHQFFYGESACSYMERIGGEIDCLILDTVHAIPGEVLDIITLLPYLKDGCVVVLHDTILQFYEGKDSFSNTALMASVVGEKYINYDDEKKEGLPNIGAIVINEETRKHIENLFQLLLIPWKYNPAEHVIESYHKSIKKNYSNELVELFEKCITLQRQVI